MPLDSARPRVALTTKNLVDELRRRADVRAPALAAIPGVVGITLNGGLSRGHGDHLSEIDLTLYLAPGMLGRWSREGSPVPLGIAMYDGWTWDIASLDLADEGARTCVLVGLPAGRRHLDPPR